MEREQEIKVLARSLQGIDDSEIEYDDMDTARKLYKLGYRLVTPEKSKSSCCGTEVKDLFWVNEGHEYQCLKCLEPCDIQPVPDDKLREKIAENLLAYHLGCTPRDSTPSEIRIANGWAKDILALIQQAGEGNNV